MGQPSLTLNARIRRNATLLLLGARALFWAAIIVTFASAIAPLNHAPHLFPWDKAEHFAAFFVVTLLAGAAYPRASLLLIALWLSLFACAIELAQALPFIHRDCDIWDWVARAAGIGACIAAILLDRWQQFNLSKPS